MYPFVQILPSFSPWTPFLNASQVRTSTILIQVVAGLAILLKYLLTRLSFYGVKGN